MANNGIFIPCRMQPTESFIVPKCLCGISWVDKKIVTRYEIHQSFFLCYFWPYLLSPSGDFFGSSWTHHFVSISWVFMVFRLSLFATLSFHHTGLLFCLNPLPFILPSFSLISRIRSRFFCLVTLVAPL